MSISMSFVLAACFGAVCQEILYWFELRKKLDSENREILKSTFYWILTFLVIVISGVGTWLLFYDNEVTVKLKIPFVLGAAFPYLFKKIVQVTQEKELPHLGKETDMSFQRVFKNYFK